MSELLDFILQQEEAFKSRNRLASLFADFRVQLSVNPDGYHANVDAWKKALADAARAGVIPSTGNTRNLLYIRAGEDLARALQHPTFGRPTCLLVVFHDAISKKEFLTLKDFLNSPTSIYHRSWVPSPWTVVQWGLRQLGVLGQPGAGDTMAIGDFVVLSNVEVAAAQILLRMASHASVVDRILSRSEFITRFGDVLGSEVSLSQRDLDILLVHLARDKKVISYNAQTIKFKADADSVPTPITQEDTAIANLRDTLTKISAQIPAIELKIAETDAASRQAVKNKQMVQAKSALRSKKLAESALQQRTDIVLQLEGVYAQLQQAADQVEIVAAMKEGALALKSLNMKVGGAEGVTEVVDMLREEMATQEEITSIISEDGGKVDEGEIEDEFEALEKAEKEIQEAKEREEREQREREEAEKTAAKFAELEQLEKERREQEQNSEKVKATEEKENVEEEILHTSQDLSRLSVDGPAETENLQQGKEKEKQPVPA